MADLTPLSRHARAGEYGIGHQVMSYRQARHMSLGVHFLVVRVALLRPLLKQVMRCLLFLVLFDQGVGDGLP